MFIQIMALMVFLSSMFSSVLFAQDSKAKDTVQSVSTGTFLLKTSLKKGQVLLNQENIGNLPLPGPWTIKPGAYELVIKGEKETIRHKFNVNEGKITELKLGQQSAQEKRDSIDTSNMMEEEYIHTGAGFSLMTTSYILGGLGVLSLAYGTYAYMDSQTLIDQADQLKKEDHVRGDQNQLVNDAEHQAFMSKTMLVAGSISIVSALTLMLFAKDGFIPLSKTADGSTDGSFQVLSTGNGLLLHSQF
jgi:hypothetical protein